MRADMEPLTSAAVFEAPNIGPLTPPSVAPLDLVVPSDPPKSNRRMTPLTLVRTEAPAWRVLAERGQYHDAWRAFDLTNPAHTPDTVHDLLLASDVARLSGHSEHALPVLRTIVQDHPRDARAALAAFTMGRVLLEELNRPREAADAFVLAGELDQDNTWVEDALAREVEAWSRAGETDRAHEVAKRFLARFPEGRAAHRVRRLGNVD
jgi:transmembrane sensor